MWKSIKNLGTQINNFAEAAYNKIKPTINALSNTLTEIASFAEDLWHIASHTLGASKSLVQSIGNGVTFILKGIKSATWDMGKVGVALANTGIALNNSQPAQVVSQPSKELQEAIEQTKKDISGSITDATNAIQHGGKAISHAGNVAYYTGDALVHLGKTAYYAGSTVYNIGSLTVEGAQYGVQCALSGAKATSEALNNMSVHLPAFNLSKAKASPILRLAAPQMNIRQDVLAAPAVISVVAASAA